MNQSIEMSSLSLVDADTPQVTVPDAMERIYSDILVAALEDENYDPARLLHQHTAAEAQHKAGKEDTKSLCVRLRVSGFLKDMFFSHLPGTKSSRNAQTHAGPDARAEEQDHYRQLGLSKDNQNQSSINRSVRSEVSAITSNQSLPVPSTRVHPYTVSSSREAFLLPSTSQSTSQRTRLRRRRQKGIMAKLFSQTDVLGGPIKIQARTLIHIAERANTDTTTDKTSQRLTTFIKDHGWMLLAICVHSPTFNSLVQTGDGISSGAIYPIIGSNATSLELYASRIKLDWTCILPGQALQQIPDNKLPLPPTTTHQVISSSSSSPDHSFYTPAYHGIEQVEITESFYNDAIWPTTKPRTARIPSTDGECALCASPVLCACTPPTDFRALIELREYPQRGIGVRSLRSIKAGEMIGTYVGEMRLPPLSDSTYVLEQDFPAENTTPAAAHSTNEKGKTVAEEATYKGICLLDASTHGNWTRFLNHSCDPAAVFISTVVGSKRCVLVCAARDIALFEEITVDYGPAYFSGGRECLCGVQGCLYRGLQAARN